MQTVSLILKPICGDNKKNAINWSSAEFSHSVLSVNLLLISLTDNFTSRNEQKRTS